MSNTIIVSKNDFEKLEKGIVVSKKGDGTARFGRQNVHLGQKLEIQNGLYGSTCKAVVVPLSIKNLVVLKQK
jgi:hypothetical protein